MLREELRISDRQNVTIAGRARTAFCVHEWTETAGAYVFAGQFSAIGHDASEDACRAAARVALLEGEE